MTQASPVRPVAKPRRMTIDNGSTGVVSDAPVRLIVYGPGGIGKTTLASRAEKAIFLPIEDGSQQLSVTRMPKAESWGDIFEALEELTTTKHSFRTLAIDPITGAETLLFRSICASKGWQSIEDAGFGKGPTIALDEWRRLLAALERWQSATRMDLVMLGHSAVQKFNDPNPLVGQYDLYNLGIEGRAAALLHNWADANLFANFEVVKKSDKARQAFASGLRYLHTTKASGYVAKNRFGLPEKMPLDWDALWSGIRAKAPEEPAKLKREIEAMLPFVDVAIADGVRGAVVGAKDDARELARIHNKLSAMVEIKEQKEETSK